MAVSLVLFNLVYVWRHRRRSTSAAGAPLSLRGLLSRRSGPDSF